MSEKEINPVGRPTVMTEETVNKLLFAFSHSFTDEEACIYANISKVTLYEYCHKNPEFTNQKELLKRTPNIKAKLNIIEGINAKDLNDSKWWLERKSKDEFGTKQNIDGNIKVENITSVSIEK